MRRPLGCFTFSALAAVAVAVLAVVGAGAASGNGMFSPGELSRVAHGGVAGGVSSHAELATRCEACHASVGSSKGMGALCLACHTDVAATIETRTGLHGRLAATADNCRTCHTEHQGASASLTLANPDVFPHEETGFSLASHQHASTTGALSCRDCHSEPSAAYTKPDCISCHQARDTTFMPAHMEAFGTECLNCHDGKETTGKSFTHAGTHASYELTGAHTSALCIGCHAGQTTTAALKATATECVACHQAKDVHEGRLGTTCAECHTTDAWTAATIDHSRTRFALVGKHTAAACESCHTQAKWTGLGTTCASCHAKDDPHAGKLGTDCASCHTEKGWKPATFDHAVTGFSLTGAHAGPSCEACHAGSAFKGTSATCESCHASAKPVTHSGVMGGACASCHTTVAWKPATFNHGKSAFPLSGAHIGVTCQKCHTAGSFASAPTVCASCHTKPASHTSAYGSACASCHTTKAWKPATFNHSKVYKLTGAHLGATCLKCHPGGVTKGAPTTCAGCHTKPASHGAAYGTACASCHTTKAWLPATFNHSKAAFPLTGAHVGVTCTKCHAGNVYKGTPTACASCHTKPASHTASYGTACASCHTTKAWLPATYNGAHAFPMNHKGAGGVCATCHAAAPPVYTCAKCHSNKSMTSTHSGVKSFSLTTCAKCHPKG